MHKESVHGPYPHGKRWRLHIHLSHGGERETSYVSFATENEAEEYKRAIEREILESQDAEALRAQAARLQEQADRVAAEADRLSARALTIAMALDEYKDHLLNEKGNKPRSVDTTMIRLKGFFAQGADALSGLTDRKAAALYKARRNGRKADTHRNELAEAKTFLHWCVGKGWIRRNPLAEVKPIGRRRRGKEQLRVDEARTFVKIAWQQARIPDEQASTRIQLVNRESALGVLVALYLGLRSSEITNIRRRDVDDGGRLLWIPDSKTDAGRRRLDVPDVLRPWLVKQAAACSGSDGRLFAHDRGWVLRNVKRLCREAGVPLVTAHGLRGMHATLATQARATSHDVARALADVAGALGHASPKVTRRHYIADGVIEQAAQRRVAEVLDEIAEHRSILETETPKTVSKAEAPIRDSTSNRRRSLKSPGFSGSKGGAEGGRTLGL